MNPAIEFFLWVAAGAAALCGVGYVIWSAWQILKLFGMLFAGAAWFFIDYYRKQKEAGR